MFAEMKNTVFISILLSFHGVNALYCFVSEIEQNPKTGLLKKTLKERNCDHSGNLLPLDIDLVENGFSCFKLVGTDSFDREVAMKGCFPTGKCDSQEIVSKIKNSSWIAADARCYECKENFCNFGANVGGSGLLVLLTWIWVLF